MFHRIEAAVLFVRDLARCTTFYRDTLGFQVQDSDVNSTGFHMENQYFLLMEISAGAQMISEEPLDLKIEGSSHGFLAAGVDDVDATYEMLRANGVKLLRSPADQSWGLRTAYFADPEGNIWEINQPVRSEPEK